MMQKCIVKEIKLFRYPHGFIGGGGIENANVCPTITISSFEWNNFIVEIYGTKTNKKRNACSTSD